MGKGGGKSTLNQQFSQRIVTRPTSAVNHSNCGFLMFFEGVLDELGPTLVGLVDKMCSQDVSNGDGKRGMGESNNTHVDQLLTATGA